MQRYPRTWQKQTRGRKGAFVWKTNHRTQGESEESEFTLPKQHKCCQFNNSA